MIRTLSTLSLTAGLLAALPAAGQTTLIDLDFTDGLTGNVFGGDAFSNPEDGFKPRFTVADDTELGGGNALFVESAGGGAEWYIPFSQPVTLTEGTSIRYSFDMRLDANSLPTTATAALRLGVYADADGSLGQDFGGQTFGSASGDFDLPDGPIAPDFGLHSRVLVGTDAVVVLRSADGARQRTENAGDTSILSGGGETVAAPFSTAPDEDVMGLDISTTNKHSFVSEWGLMDVEGETMLTATYTVTDADGSATIMGDDPLTDPDLATFDPTYHYMVFRNTVDFDYVLDNIKVEFIGGATSIEGDYDNGGQVEQTDLDFVLSNWGDTDVSDVTGWINFPGGGAFDGLVDQNELDGVLLNWGSTSVPDFSGSAVPEPAVLGVLAAAGLLARRRRA